MRDPSIGLTALVVEDDWFVREDIANVFRHERWAVLEAATGAGALKWLRETKTLDLLITDIHLANAMTGWEVAEAARELHPRILVIYASGNPNNDNRRVPDSIFLSKPVSARELLLACHELLSSAPARDIATSAASIWTRRETDP